MKELWFTFANIFLHPHRCWCWNPWSPWCTTGCAVLRCQQRLCHCLLEATCCWWRKPHPWIFHWQVSECAGLENSYCCSFQLKNLKAHWKTWDKRVVYYFHSCCWPEENWLFFFLIGLAFMSFNCIERILCDLHSSALTASSEAWKASGFCSVW